MISGRNAGLHEVQAGYSKDNSHEYSGGLSPLQPWLVCNPFRSHQHHPDGDTALDA